MRIRIYKTGPKWVAPVFFLITFSLGPGALYLAHNMSVKAKAVQTWPSVEGKLISFEWRYVSTGGGGRTRHRSRIPILKYEYEAGGVGYQGNQITVDPDNSIKRSSRVYSISKGKSLSLSKVREGESIRVYYNSKNPQDSILDPYAKNNVGFLRFLGIVLILFGIIGIFTQIKGKRAPFTGQLVAGTDAQ